MADLLFIWSIQFYSTYHLTNRYEYLEHIYNTITDLTPLYKEPYIVGSWIMALEVGDIPMAIRLLEKGARNMKDEWIFEYECGYYAYKYLKNYNLAEKHFAAAAANPKAPDLIVRQRAHMIYMENNLEYAYDLWLDILNKAENPSFARSAALNHLYQIKYEMDKRNVEQAIKVFHNRHHRNPFSLEELVRAGFLRVIPRDFRGADYVYKSATGTLEAIKEFKWKQQY